MNIFIYSDESGVFDKEHNEYFVFAGLIYLDKSDKDIAVRKYKSVERKIRASAHTNHTGELKANSLSNKHKNSIFRSLNDTYKFAVVIKQKDIFPRIFESKKTKQRYLDYAYKRAVKNALENLCSKSFISRNDVENIFFFVDEHTTATDGKYELREGLEQELKYGTYNMDYSLFFPPVFPNMNRIELRFCNSASTPLIRAADIVANNIYHKVLSSTEINVTNLNIIYLPK